MSMQFAMNNSPAATTSAHADFLFNTKREVKPRSVNTSKTSFEVNYTELNNYLETQGKEKITSARGVHQPVMEYMHKKFDISTEDIASLYTYFHKNAIINFSAWKFGSGNKLNSLTYTEGMKQKLIEHMRAKGYKMEPTELEAHEAIYNRNPVYKVVQFQAGQDEESHPFSLGVVLLDKRADGTTTVMY